MARAKRARRYGPARVPCPEKCAEMLCYPSLVTTFSPDLHLPPPYSSPAGSDMTDAEPPWRDSRFPASVEAVRKACGVPAHDHEDDVMIGMMLDRFGWDHAKVEDAYALLTEAARRSRPRTDQAAHPGRRPGASNSFHTTTKWATSSRSSRARRSIAGRRAESRRPRPPAPSVRAHVIGSYELRYGQGDNTTSELVTPAEFTTYMLFVTQWRWIQCERYTRRHGELGWRTSPATRRPAASRVRRAVANARPRARRVGTGP